MRHSSERLPRAITLRTYTECKTWVSHVMTGAFQLLFLIGRPGLGKSQIALQLLGQRRHAFIECHATKLAFYCKLFEHRDEPVVIDDENSLVKDPGKLALMNCLCQTNAVKTLRWDSTTRHLEERGVPAEFRTGSPVLVITNQLRNLSPQVTAMLDRGHSILFEPPAAEIHHEVGAWFGDAEVYRFVADWLPMIPNLSMRDYVKAHDMKKAGLDWRKVLPEQWRCGAVGQVLALLKDASFKNEEERVRAFAEQGGSKSTYYRCLEKLKRLGAWPPRKA